MNTIQNTSNTSYVDTVIYRSRDIFLLRSSPRRDRVFRHDKCGDHVHSEFYCAVYIFCRYTVYQYLYAVLSAFNPWFQYVLLVPIVFATESRPPTYSTWSWFFRNLFAQMKIHAALFRAAFAQQCKTPSTRGAFFVSLDIKVRRIAESLLFLSHPISRCDAKKKRINSCSLSKWEKNDGEKKNEIR